MKKGSGLATKMDRLDIAVIAFQISGMTRKRYCPLDERSQLLCLRQGRDDALILRIDQRGGKTAQQ
jgi:hypothetical protein